MICYKSEISTSFSTGQYFPKLPCTCTDQMNKLLDNLPKSKIPRSWTKGVLMFVVNTSITNHILPRMCGLKTNDVAGPKIGGFPNPFCHSSLKPCPLEKLERKDRDNKIGSVLQLCSGFAVGKALSRN